MIANVGVSQTISSEANIFQKYLIPSQSHYVRFSMQKAGVFANRSNFFFSHFLSVGCAIAAIALSFFNTFIYLLQAPFRVLLHVVQLSPFRAIFGFLEDLTNVARSLVFVSMGTTFIVAGLFFPKAVFSHFAPEYYDSLEERLDHENARLRKKIERLEADLSEVTKVAEKATLLVQERENELDRLRHPAKSWVYKKCMPFFERYYNKAKRLIGLS